MAGAGRRRRPAQFARPAGVVWVLFRACTRVSAVQLFSVPERPFDYVRVCGCPIEDAMLFLSLEPGCAWALYTPTILGERGFSQRFDREAVIEPPHFSRRSWFRV